jgi:hypothetical protein
MRAGARRRRRTGRWVASILGIVAVVFVLLLVFSSGTRAAANSFILAFRVQQKTSKLAIILAPFPAPPAGQATPSVQTLASLGRLDLSGGHTVAALDDAQALLDFSIERVRRFPGPSDITVYQNATATLTPDTTAIQSFLGAGNSNSGGSGSSERSPLQELTATHIQAQIGEAVRQRWDKLGLALTYWQLLPPRLSTTSGTSFDQLRTQAIQAYFLIEPQTAQQLLQVQDWDHTVVIPIPPGAQMRTVRVDRQQATLIATSGTSSADSFLVWQNNGVLNYLHAPVTGDELLNYASSVGGD